MTVKEESKTSGEKWVFPGPQLKCPHCGVYKGQRHDKACPIRRQQETRESVAKGA